MSKQYLKERISLGRKLVPPVVLGLLAVISFRIDFSLMTPILAIILITLLGILLFIFIRQFIFQDRKLYVADNGNISVPIVQWLGYKFHTNTYAHMGYLTQGTTWIQFTKDNIKKAVIVSDMKDIENLLDESYKNRRGKNFQTISSDKQGFQISNVVQTEPGKIVCIEFKKPLVHELRTIHMRLAYKKLKFPDLDKIYVSLDEPELFLKEINKQVG